MCRIVLSWNEKEEEGPVSQLEVAEWRELFDMKKSDFFWEKGIVIRIIQTNSEYKLLLTVKKKNMVPIYILLRRSP